MAVLLQQVMLCHQNPLDHDADGPAAAHPLPVVLQGPAAFPTLLSSPLAGPSKYLGLIVWLITFD